MKNVYKKLLVVASGLMAFSASAQVSLYGFSQYQGTYIPITGGTVFATSTTDDGTFVNPSNPTLNQATGPGIPIGFPFVFNFHSYDVVGIDNNGWISFGQSALTPNPINLNNSALGQGISGTSTAPAILQNRVSVFGRDLVSNSGSLRVETVGSAPNRECVIQWTNYKVFLGSDLLNFQIRLKETSNIVDIVYGSQTITSTTGGQVGLRGDANTDFNNRSVTSPTVWANSIPGITNTDVCNIATGFQPISGQVYEWTPPPPCTGAPASNSVASTFSLICPGGSSTLSLLNTYSNTGISYQWYVSDQSVVGPFTVVPTATNSSYAASNVTVTSWYQAVVTCSVGPQSSTATAYGVNIAGVTINNVPYYEGFEGITVNNQLPNCSWAASNLPTINQTYTLANANNRLPHTGSKFASFRFGTSGAGDYFYTNGIQMNAGVTYSAAVWYITDGSQGWSNFSINLGTTQSTVGLLPVASVTGAVSGTFYQLLSNTFTVATSGIYYVAIKCIGNSTPNFLTFDDLSITIPCQLNAPTVTIATSPANLCSDDDITITATGADAYTWSTGEVTSAITFIPHSQIVNMTVVATNTASGCSTTVTPMLNVNASPAVSIFVPTPSVCLGSSAALFAFGSNGNTYSWNTGSANSTTTVTPTVSTPYTVTATNANGCKATAVTVIGVNPLPVVTAVNSAPNELCAGETATLTGSGAISYQWSSNSSIILTQQALVNPSSSTVYTLTGTDFRGCSASVLINLNVSACVGLNEITSELNGVSLYPNPSNGAFTVELANGLSKQVVVTDLTGRVVLKGNSSEDKLNMSLDGLATGVYSVKITSGNASQTIKLVKN